MGRLVKDDTELEDDMTKNVDWDEDASIKLQRARRALRVRGASLDMDCVRKGDKEQGEKVFADDDPLIFAQTLRDIGQRFVVDIDGGACPRRSLRGAIRLWNLSSRSWALMMAHGS